MLEKTIYEIKYNDWFNIRMQSEREPMEEIEFDKAALQAVLADIVLRETGCPGTLDETQRLWGWILTEIGMALQHTGLVPDSEDGSLAALLRAAPRLMEMEQR